MTMRWKRTSQKVTSTVRTDVFPETEQANKKRRFQPEDNVDTETAVPSYAAKQVGESHSKLVLSGVQKFDLAGHVVAVEAAIAHLVCTLVSQQPVLLLPP